MKKVNAKRSAQAKAEAAARRAATAAEDARKLAQFEGEIEEDDDNENDCYMCLAPVIEIPIETISVSFGKGDKEKILEALNLLGSRSI